MSRHEDLEDAGHIDPSLGWDVVHSSIGDSSESTLLSDSVPLVGLHHPDTNVRWSTPLMELVSKNPIRPGTQNQGYRDAIDYENTFEGEPTLRLQSPHRASAKDWAATSGGVGVTAAFCGRRVRMRTYVRTDSILEGAQIWFRVEARFQQSLDNMRNPEPRGLRGSHDWTLYELVLDVHPGADRLAFGQWFMGQGTMWMSAPEFEVVGLDVPETPHTIKRF